MGGSCARPHALGRLAGPPWGAGMPTATAPPILRVVVSAQYIFTTYKLSRRYPPDRQVLEDISLSFLPGAKIGVLGYNGAGKSALLRILAGLDPDLDRPAQLAPGATLGLLQ